MSFNGTSVGLDVHALSVVAHAVDEETGHVERARLCPDHGEILGWLHRLRGPVRVAYEADPTGFGLARALKDAEIDCVVAAPSKLIRPSGDRVKTDARDAARLTRLLRLGEMTAVTVPEAEVEAVRDLMRAREDARAEHIVARSPVVSRVLLGVRFFLGSPFPGTTPVDSSPRLFGEFGAVDGSSGCTAPRECSPQLGHTVV